MQQSEFCPCTKIRRARFRTRAKGKYRDCPSCVLVFIVSLIVPGLVHVLVHNLDFVFVFAFVLLLVLLLVVVVCTT